MNTAIISPCGLYRYRLTRALDGCDTLAVIMVNPSTADAETDDPTIRKLIGFGHRWGFGRLVVGNLYAYRATDVGELGRVDDPIGPDNDDHLARIMSEASRIVVAWGPMAKQPRAWRAARLRRFLDIAGAAQLFQIGPPTQDGMPHHPLMLPYDLELQPWRAPS